MLRKSLMMAVILMVAAVLALSACGNSNKSSNNGPVNEGAASPTNSSEPTKEVKPINIKFWIYPFLQGLKGDGTGEFDDWAKDFAQKFKETHPNVTVDIEILDWAGGTEKVDVSVAAGSPPDMVYTINNFGAVTKYGKMGVLEPITPYLTKEDLDDYSDAVKGAMKYGDEYYLWPNSTSITGYAVNLDLFAERNASDLLPINRELRDWTFDEFVKAAQTTTFSRSGKQTPDVYGTGIWGKDGVFYDYLFGVAGGGNVMNDSFSEVTVDQPAFINGLNFMVDLQNKHHVVPPGAAGLSYGNIVDMFLNQQIAMVPAGPDMMANVAKAPKPFQAAFIAPPHAEGQPTQAWNNVGGFVVFKQQDEAKKQAVMEFAKFITNTENSKIMKLIGVFPPRISTGNLYGEDPLMTYAGKLSSYGNSVFSRSFGLATVAEWEQELQAMLTGAKTADKAMASMAGILQANLAK